MKPQTKIGTLNAILMMSVTFLLMNLSQPVEQYFAASDPTLAAALTGANGRFGALFGLLFNGIGVVGQFVIAEKSRRGAVRAARCGFRLVAIGTGVSALSVAVALNGIGEAWSLVAWFSASLPLLLFCQSCVGFFQGTSRAGLGMAVNLLIVAVNCGVLVAYSRCPGGVGVEGLGVARLAGAAAGVIAAGWLMWREPASTCCDERVFRSMARLALAVGAQQFLLCSIVWLVAEAMRELGDAEAAAFGATTRSVYVFVFALSAGISNWVNLRAVAVLQKDPAAGARLMRVALAWAVPMAVIAPWLAFWLVSDWFYDAFCGTPAVRLAAGRVILWLIAFHLVDLTINLATAVLRAAKELGSLILAAGAGLATYTAWFVLYPGRSLDTVFEGFVLAETVVALVLVSRVLSLRRRMQLTTEVFTPDGACGNVGFDDESQHPEAS